mmetsp:Transcript_29020/g.60704  ORF Transcript_29020/g.60704 Transcript_29020/m.60704 type:complete len:208 (-) Transcript_29020:214-837(-)
MMAAVVADNAWFFLVGDVAVWHQMGFGRCCQCRWLLFLILRLLQWLRNVGNPTIIFFFHGQGGWLFIVIDDRNGLGRCESRWLFVHGEKGFGNQCRWLFEFIRQGGRNRFVMFIFKRQDASPGRFVFVKGRGRLLSIFVWIVWCRQLRFFMLLIFRQESTIGGQDASDALTQLFRLTLGHLQRGWILIFLARRDRGYLILVVGCNGG